MGMVLTFLGIVLWATLFDTILAQFDVLMGYTHLSSFTLLQTMYQIGSVILFLGVLGLLGWGYYNSYMTSNKAGSWCQHADVGGFRRPPDTSFFGAVLNRHQLAVHHSGTPASQVTSPCKLWFKSPLQSSFFPGIFAGGWNISTGIRNQKKKKAAGLPITAPRPSFTWPVNRVGRRPPKLATNSIEH